MEQTMQERMEHLMVKFELNLDRIYAKKMPISTECMPNKRYL